MVWGAIRWGWLAVVIILILSLIAGRVYGVLSIRRLQKITGLDIYEMAAAIQQYEFARKVYGPITRDPAAYEDDSESSDEHEMDETV